MLARTALVVGALGLAVVPSSRALEPGEPIKLAWYEGDLAGTTTVYASENAGPIGIVEYRQRRDGDILTAVRIARFSDGSSDEDQAVARLDGRLHALSGRSIVRDTDGQAVADLRIDVAQGRLDATWGRDGERQESTEQVALPPGTYWGPLIFIVLRNFAANADRDRLVFRTVAPTPRPYVLDMEITRGDDTTIERVGIRLPAREFVLRPTLHWAIDPLVQWIVPAGRFWASPGEPPAMLRFAGPRNYQRQRIVIE